jgi:ATP-dependent helicase/nuclease subunit A
LNGVQESENRKLVQAQAAAAQTLDRHVSVTAGPGSGKTTVLIERYLHILKTVDISIDQIVAITFTNRAATEMRDRLRQQLDSLILTSDTRDQARWAQQKRRLDGAIITTIHGFCAGLLREFPIESGLDPEFTLLDEHQTVLLEETIAKRTLTDWISSGDPDVSRLTAGIGRIKLASTLAAIYRSVRSQGISVGVLAERTVASHGSAEEYVDILNQVGLAIADLTIVRGLSRVAESKRKAIQHNWPALRAKLNLGPSGFETAAFCRLIEDLRTTWRPSAQGTLKPMVQELDRLLWGKDLSGLLPRVWLDFEAREYAAKLAEITADLERQLRAEKQRIGALDFDDLQTGVLDMLERHPEVLKKIAARYRYFLIDEFQDTNSLQRDLVKRLVLDKPSEVNAFIVGDPKQSIYGFRGADVPVFREMALALETRGGASLPLHLNFRSQGPLIHCFNHIFRHVFAPVPEMEDSEREELGFVAHEDSVPQLGPTGSACPVEFLIDTGGGVQYQSREPSGSPRDRDARQVAARCRQLTAGVDNEYDRPTHRFKYSEIAILFRAMTQASIYETVLRRAGIPYQTIQGRGFYDRQEVTDLIQLMRFLDNRTDDIALAAVLRSPICGISDDSLLAIGAESLLRPDSGQPRRRTWSLWSSLLGHARNGLIPDRDRAAVARAASVLSELVNVRRGYRVSELLRLAAEKAEYQPIIASSFDGAQRIANVEKLFSLAERFEGSGAHNIRDFVRFVADFERSSGREGEGRIDESEDAVRLMTIHQAKGLQFPVVIVPELHRKRQENLDWFILDRQRGLTVKVPDGRAGLATGITMERLRERARWREKFESARLLYVGATRAQDRLILTGAAPESSRPRQSEPDPADMDDQETGGDTWLSWIFRALGLRVDSLKGERIDVGEGAAIRVEINLANTMVDYQTPKRRVRRFSGGLGDIDLSRTPNELFPLLAQIDGAATARSLSVTQLTNFTRCPRQYYFNRVLHAPERGELSGWEQAEATEPPSNLTASLKGAVIHLFCERFAKGLDPDICLRSSLDHVLRVRMADRGEGVSGVNREAAISELRPLVDNYLASQVRERIDSVRTTVRADAPGNQGPHGMDKAVFSEQRFTLKATGKAIRGTIDKLLIARNERSELEAEIIDFKTNRFRAGASEGLLKTAIESAVEGVRMQMQIYALAVRELTPELASVRATLHFVDPNVEYALPAEALDASTCSQALEGVLSKVDQAAKSDTYPPQVGGHCRHCGFLGICQPGRIAIRSARNR